MPVINVVRQIEPEYKITGDFSFSDADITAAFSGLSSSEGQELFYNLFSPAWRSKSPDEQLALLARLAQLVVKPPVPEPAVSARFVLPDSASKK